MAKVRGGVRRRGMIRGAGLLLFPAALAACELDPTDSRFGGHPPVEGAALELEDGTPLTPPFTLPSGGPHRVRVRYLDGNGRPIGSLDGEHRGGLIWRPGGRAESRTVEEPMVFEVTFTAPCNPPQEVVIGYGHDVRANERRFGPYPVEIEGGFGGARLLRADSTVLTPTVRLPAREPTEVIAQILDCDGVVVEALEGYEVILFWEPAEFASWQRLDEIGARNLVTVNADAGRRGFMSVGVRREGATWHEALGPFRVVAE